MTLKKQDPFLYYSIPSVRREAVCGRSSGNKGSIDVSSSLLQYDSRRVERRSCISFECHTDLLLEDCFLDWSSSPASECATAGDDDLSYAPHEGPVDVDELDSMIDQLLRLRRHKQ